MTGSVTRLFPLVDTRPEPLPMGSPPVFRRDASMENGVAGMVSERSPRTRDDCDGAMVPGGRVMRPMAAGNPAGRNPGPGVGSRIRPDELSDNPLTGVVGRDTPGGGPTAGGRHAQ